MNIAAVRRLSLAGIGLVGTAAITVACSSSTSGNGVAPTDAATSISVPTGVPSSLPPVSLPASLSASIPSLPASGIPTLGGSKFCTDLSKVGTLGSSLGSGGNLDKLLSGLDALVAEAPAEVKPDLQLLDQYVHDAANGKMDTNLTNKITTAGEHIATYLASNCHP